MVLWAYTKWFLIHLSNSPGVFTHYIKRHYHRSIVFTISHRFAVIEDPQYVLEINCEWRVKAIHPGYYWNVRRTEPFVGAFGRAIDQARIAIRNMIIFQWFATLSFDCWYALLSSLWCDVHGTLSSVIKS